MYQNGFLGDFVAGVEWVARRGKKKRYSQVLETLAQVKASHKHIALEAQPPADAPKESIESSEKQGLEQHPIETQEVLGNSEAEEMQELVFEREEGAVDFEPETVYSWDTIGEKPTASGKTYTPPPDFQTALKAFPQELYQVFREKLRGEIVGIWPIKSDALQNKK